MFDFMRIKFGSKTIIIRKYAGERLLNILQESITTEYAGSSVHPTTDDIAIELIREGDLKPHELEVLEMVDPSKPTD